MLFTEPDNSEYIFFIANTPLLFGVFETHFFQQSFIFRNKLALLEKILLILLKNKLALVIQGRIGPLGVIWVKWFSPISKPVNNMILYFRVAGGCSGRTRKKIKFFWKTQDFVFTSFGVKEKKLRKFPPGHQI